MRTPLPPQHMLCPTCGHRVVFATLADGCHVAIDDDLRAYRVILNADNVTYRAEPSGARPVHACLGKE